MQVFVSHASTEHDLLLARALAAALRRAEIEPWLDEERLPPGRKLEGDLRSAIDHSEAGVFLVSGSWVESKWCQWELAQFNGRPQPPVLVALLRQPRHELAHLLGPDFSALTTMDWPDDGQSSEERFWRLYCGLKLEAPGPQQDWKTKGGAWWTAATQPADVPPPRATLPDSIMRGPYSSISLRCDRTRQWGTIVTHASLPRHEIIVVPGRRGFGHQHLLARIAEGLTDPPRAMKEVSWRDRRPDTVPDLLELLLESLTDRPPAAGPIETRVANQVSALLATRNVVLIHPVLRGAFDRASAVADYYGSALPAILGPAARPHYLKCVQPIEWMPTTFRARLAAGATEAIGALMLDRPGSSLEGAALEFIERLKSHAPPHIPVTILPPLEPIPHDELTEFLETLDLTPRQRTALFDRVLSVAQTPDELFQAIDDFYPEVRGDTP